MTGGESSIAYDGSNFIGNLFYGSDGWMSLDLDGLPDLPRRGPQAGASR